MQFMDIFIAEKNIIVVTFGKIYFLTIFAITTVKTEPGSLDCGIDYFVSTYHMSYLFIFLSDNKTAM